MAEPEPPTVEWLVEHFGMVDLDVEGGRFHQSWQSHRHWPGNDRPAGSAILFLLTTDPGDFSALHRLPTDEIWHRYLGDPATLLLLHPDGTGEEIVLGPDLHRGQRVQHVVPAGTFMGCSVAPGGPAGYALLGCSMAPGFSPEDYEGGDRDALTASHPSFADRIEALTRPERPNRMSS